MPPLDPITLDLPRSQASQDLERDQERKKQRKDDQDRLFLAMAVLDSLARAMGLGPQVIQPGLGAGTWGPFGSGPRSTSPPDMSELVRSMVERYGASTATAYGPNRSSAPPPSPGPPGLQNIARGVTSIDWNDYDRSKYKEPWEDPYWQQKYAHLVLGLPEEEMRRYGNHTRGWWRSRANWNNPDAGWDYTGPHKNWSQVPPEERPSGARTGNMNRALRKGGPLTYRGRSPDQWLRLLRTGEYGGSPVDPIARWGTDWWLKFIDWMESRS